jgi:omega-hydroxy-beta-dihydromenaquinone-9 sulfotransferase
VAARPSRYRESVFNNLGYQFGLIGFTSFSSLSRLLHYSLFLHPRYVGRGLLVLSTSVASVPLRLWERVRHGSRIAAVRVEPPIFVIGHWRSGTTHLHNLISQDRSLGYLTMYQAMVPGCSLVGERWLKPLLARLVPRKRPMDNMVWPIDAPQEEEIPLAKITPYSLYVRFLFPRKAPHLFRKYVLLQDAPPRIVSEIKRKYYWLLQVATIHAGGRRLVLKNPVNTARVRLLLELFPDAKFIHVYRSPYDVFASTGHMHARMLPITTLQSLPRGSRSEAILALYEDMMRRYFEDRALIPAGNLVEVRFEDVERDPMGQVRRMYETLGLPGYAAMEPALQAYVASQRTYKKNALEISAADRASIEQRWGFAMAELAYGVEAAI